ncbi:MAG: putative ABC transporter permease [Candidatus Nomurabacteria bacterium]|jgi:uncharacterized membrane protein|nr:putative ABC transporter permease [Candidatus Nomurabacteria bacterium]
MTFTFIVLVFFIGSVIGWIWETIYCSAKAGHFLYRGLLAGPYCPIYGFGALLFLPLVELKANPVYLVVVAMVFATAIEYTTSIILDRLLKVQLWNYRSEHLNIEGRVCLKATLMWGALALFFIYILEPQIRVLALQAYALFGVWLALGLVAVMTTDAIFTITRLAQFRSFMAKARTGIESTVESYVKLLEDSRHRSRLRATERRLIKAFPQLKTPETGGKTELSHLLRADIALKKAIKNAKAHARV